MRLRFGLTEELPQHPRTWDLVRFALRKLGPWMVALVFTVYLSFALPSSLGKSLAMVLAYALVVGTLFSAIRGALRHLHNHFAELDMVRFSLLYTMGTNELYRIEPIRISALDTKLAGARGVDKLAGVKIGHFGAFFDADWRKNDILWGRLDACERLFNTVNDRFHRCDVLVNNAGATRAGAFLELPDAAWLDGYALKFFGCVRLTRLFWPLLKAAQGSVVNIVGGAGRTPEAEFLIGGSVNAAVANFSKGLSKLGNRDNVNVNVIHPGNTDTERQQQLREQRATALGKTVEELREEALAKNNLRRFGKPEDIAALALFLCSERARHIQGTAIAVDGGATPGLH